ncbi:MAG TPA: CDP-alcohol phosphatidyltransferase family protein [Candidatus Marinimicrobia bacterium]|jgi:CDP-diacylglycerol--glycerol-3-phosphate 3-phosphatidyltransferase|nr:CDP-alcohol phosphatidyltransferase family protein [Candidatus Neomarinimicrobiota bacterium]HJL74649.1 CDP-alcohol phosphatidyltransferase family protein [Candidatus Neomarinimicrobiota bacterium]HJM69843.1 CDP-alcohol phosphatidyltransferase family protein [Candidatus Neomarinimicrobiota bacterium]|tara:strand:- start:1551 stop:2144 length:594 start_codon:yes stop_codon:yes gene_type:complete
MGNKVKFDFNDLKTIPNILSVSRLVLIPAMLIPCFLIGDDMLARKVFLIMFILIGVTDKLDGTLARYLNQTSKLGAELDTLADTVFYPFIALWLYRFESAVVGEWWSLVYILLGLFFLKMILGKMKFGKIPTFHTIGGKTFAASLFFFMITAMLYPDIAKRLFPLLCAIGYINQLEEMYIFLTRDSVDENIKSVFSK